MAGGAVRGEDGPGPPARPLPGRGPGASGPGRAGGAGAPGPLGGGGGPGPGLPGAGARGLGGPGPDARGPPPEAGGELPGRARLPRHLPPSWAGGRGVDRLLLRAVRPPPPRGHLGPASGPRPQGGGPLPKAPSRRGPRAPPRGPLARERLLRPGGAGPPGPLLLRGGAGGGPGHDAPFRGVSPEVYGELYPVPEEVERALPRYQVYYLLAHVHFFGQGYLGALWRAISAS